MTCSSGVFFYVKQNYRKLKWSGFEGSHMCWLVSYKRLRGKSEQGLFDTSYCELVKYADLKNSRLERNIQCWTRIFFLWTSVPAFWYWASGEKTHLVTIWCFFIYTVVLAVVNYLEFFNFSCFHNSCSNHLPSQLIL